MKEWIMEWISNHKEGIATLEIISIAIGLRKIWDKMHP